MKRATIKDIAAVAGVNISTVSRALRDHPDIGITLRTKIKQLANEMHYHPNMLAVQLRKQKSNTIGLIIPEANMFFVPSVIKGISNAVQKAGYRLLVLQSGESYEQELENVAICNEYGVVGLLISLTNETDNLNHLLELKDSGTPIVLLDKSLDNSIIDEVIIDDLEGTQTCIKYLIEIGCKKIIGLFGNPNLMITHKRLEGFLNSVKTFSAQNSIESEFQFVDSTFSAWAYVENRFPDFQPDAIFAMSDEIIAGVVPALKKMKVKIPEQCSVIGISDGYLPKILDPHVKFLHHDGYALGELAANQLIKNLTMPKSSSVQERLILPTRLVLNHSI
jgi:LacI family transcriptional regulator